MKKIFTNHLFVIQLLADLISNFGDSLFYLALLQYILSLPQETATIAISIITFSETVPMLLHIYTGYLADRTKKILLAILTTMLIRMGLYVIVGIIVGFTPSLVLVIAIATINFISDCLGTYESGLFIPINLAIVSNDERAEFMGFRQTVTASTNILFKVSGAMLVTWFTYQQLAFINAGTFLLAAVVFSFIMSPLKKRLVQANIATTTKTDEPTEKSSFIQQLKMVFTNVKGYPLLLNTTISFVLFNAIFSALNIYIMQYMNLYESFIIVNVATTNTIVSVILSVGNIIGSIFSMNLFKKMSLLSLNKMSYIFGCGIFAGLLFKNIYVVLVMLLLTIVFSAAIMPKYSTLVMNTLPQNILSTTIGALNTVLPVGAVAVSLLVSILLPFVPVGWLIIINSALMLLFALSLFRVKSENML